MRAQCTAPNRCAPAFAYARSNVDARPGPAYALRLPSWLLAAFWISQSWLNHTRFATAEWRRFLLTAVVAAGLMLALVLLRAGDLLVAGPNWDPTQAKSLATLNQMISGVLVLASVFAGLLCLHELRRSLRRLGSDRRTADSAS